MSREFVADLSTNRKVNNFHTDSPFQGLDNWSTEYRYQQQNGVVNSQTISIAGELNFSGNEILSGIIKDWNLQSGFIYIPPDQSFSNARFSTLGLYDIYKSFDPSIVNKKISSDIFKWSLTGDDNISTVSSVIGGVLPQGYNANDKIYSYSGNDFIFAGAGLDYIDGGDGVDTASYLGKAKDYTINKGVGYILVGDLIANRDGLDTLVNIEKLQFVDYTIDVSKSAPIDKTVYMLYKAAFGRVPDVSGFDYWTTQAETKGYTATQLASYFSQSNEFKILIGDNSANENYVAKLYQNVLGRAPDITGEAFWIDQLNKGQPRDLILASFAVSPENVGATEAYVKDGYWLL